MVLLVFVGTFGSSSLDDTCCGFVKNSSRLPEGYVKSKSIAYHKYYTNVVTWYEALRICRGDGGNLAVIDSREEAEVRELRYDPTCDVISGIRLSRYRYSAG